MHPAEIASEIGVDFVIALSAAQSDVQQQVQQFTLAPTSLRVYSARERAVLDADAAQMQALGFNDSVVEPPPPPSAESSDSTVDARTSDTQDVNEDDAPASDESPPVESADADDAETAAPALATPPPLTQAERNVIEPPGEATVPLRGLLMESFRDRYRDYTRRVASRLACDALPQRYEVVHVLAAQSLCVILDQCVQALTGVRPVSLRDLRASCASVSLHAD